MFSDMSKKEVEMERANERKIKKKISIKKKGGQKRLIA